MSKKTIFKIHNRDRGFTQVDNNIIDDKELSWKAKGLLVYLLSKPEDWKIYIKNLSQASKDGKTSTNSALKELIEKEYVFKGKVRGKDGKFKGYRYDVYEIPPRKQEISPKSENPISENPKNGESPTTNIDITNKENKNNNTSMDFDKSTLTGKEINSLIGMFEPVNPSYDNLFHMNTQRDAIKELVDKFGKGEVANLIEILEEINSQQYAPTITTPHQLLQKLGKLKAFIQRSKQDNNSKRVL